MSEPTLLIPPAAHPATAPAPFPKESPLRSFLKLCRRVLWRERPWGRAWTAAAEARRRTAIILSQWEAGRRFPSELIHPRSLAWYHVVKENWAQFSRTEYEADKPRENQVKEWITLVLPYSMVTIDGLLSLADQVRYCEENRLPGVFVETGCNQGGSAALMARASLHYGHAPRAIHVFDSFEGLPQPDAAKDTDPWIENSWKIPKEQHQGKMVTTGSMVAAEDNVREVFRRVGFPPSRLHIHKGWFCDTVPPFAAQKEPIALLRLDGDLYSSTWDVLIHLYPLVIEGGIVVIDDYNVTGARRAIEDYLATLPRRPYVCRADGAVSYFVKQR